MPDQFDSKKRSEIMAKVHSANTMPEKYVCSLLEDFGFTFFLHVDGLLGRSDIVLPDFNKIIFVNGCFWHSCPLCKHAKIRPKKIANFWNKKLDRTLEHDKENKLKLEELGYRILIIWECETKKKNYDLLKNKIMDFIR